MTKVFLDTNVLIDLLVASRPRHNDAVKLMEMIGRGFFRGAVSTQSIIDVAYITGRSDKDVYSRYRAILEDLMSGLEVFSITAEDIHWARTCHISDFEDAAQFSAALSNYCSVFISSNEKFKTYSRMWTFTPGEFLDYVFGDYPSLLRD